MNEQTLICRRWPRSLSCHINVHFALKGHPCPIYRNHSSFCSIFFCLQHALPRQLLWLQRHRQQLLLGQTPRPCQALRLLQAPPQRRAQAPRQPKLLRLRLPSRQSRRHQHSRRSVPPSAKSCSLRFGRWCATGMCTVITVGLIGMRYELNMNRKLPPRHLKKRCTICFVP